MTKSIDVNIYAFGNGAGNPDCEKGAQTIQEALKKTAIANRYHFLPPLSVETHRQQSQALPDILALSEKLAASTKKSVLENKLFITIGGDHTAAIGSWSGAASAKNPIGLIWFDAHMDSHTPQTSESQNIHGMPLAVLLGYGEKRLTQLGNNQPKLKPENTVLIGIRSFEAGEAALLAKLGVRIFDMQTIQKWGMKKVVAEALDIVTRNTAGFGISIDLDGFDPIDAPGVGTPAPAGVRAAEFLDEFKAIAQHPKLIGADIVEFNPVLDVENKTEKLAVTLFDYFANAEAAR